MGVAKCSFGCGHAPKELRCDLSPISDRYSIRATSPPLTMHDVFEYHGIDGQSVESKDFDELEASNGLEPTLSTPRARDRGTEMNGRIDLLLSGYIRSAMHEIRLSDQYHNYVGLICSRYYLGMCPSNLLFCFGCDLKDKRMADLMDLLHGHWDMNMNQEHQLHHDEMHFIHLEPVFSGTIERMVKCRDKWDINGHVVVLIESTSCHLFGGYTSRFGTTCYDPTAFLFSLTTHRVFHINKDKVETTNVFHDHENPHTLIHFGEGPDLMIRDGNDHVHQCIPSSFDFHEDFVREQDTDGQFLVKCITIFQVYGK